MQAECKSAGKHFSGIRAVIFSGETFPAVVFFHKKLFYNKAAVKYLRERIQAGEEKTPAALRTGEEGII